MNYLAHIFLSGRNPDILFGNLLEDFTKGNIDHPRNSHLNSDVKKGLLLHRNIDTFMDAHLLVRDCKVLFYPQFGKYSPIILDVIFDYFLAKNWSIYSSEDFLDFENRVEMDLSAKIPEMPVEMRKMVESMINHHWLRNYARVEGIEKAFQNLNHKIAHKVNLVEAIPITFKNEDFINEKFNSFMPQMIELCNEIIEK